MKSNCLTRLFILSAIGLLALARADGTNLSVTVDDSMSMTGEQPSASDIVETSEIASMSPIMSEFTESEAPEPASTESEEKEPGPTGTETEEEEPEMTGAEPEEILIEGDEGEAPGEAIVWTRIRHQCQPSHYWNGRCHKCIRSHYWDGRCHKCTHAYYRKHGHC
ncbi:hypothetical protein IWQ60_006977 [Tieghemiomyces parasiticus]|uniref:Uncharacterized protein n=1 Tax=Tieghemiomyces parasiticus TaxID=78921 RepID=A0A9W8DWA2_9FUNG|nr:hypothetical protein IWQ60_006977 [Tieghemiomyces parasiticus]